MGIEYVFNKLVRFSIWNPLHDLVPFLQFKNREKNLRKSATFSKVATLLKLTLLHGRFSRLLNCTNGTNSAKSHIQINPRKMQSWVVHDVFYVVLMSVSITLYRSHSLFWCFHCWLWTSKCSWGWLSETFYLLWYLSKKVQNTKAIPLLRCLLFFCANSHNLKM